MLIHGFEPLMKKLWRVLRPKKVGVHENGHPPSLSVHRQVDALHPANRFSPGDDFSKWRVDALEQLEALLGIEYLPSRDIIQVTHDWTRPVPGGVAHKSSLVLSDGSNIPICVATPQSAERKPSGLIICLQGHSPGMHVSLGLDASWSRAFDTGTKSLNFGTQSLLNNFEVVCIEQESFGQRSETQLKRVAPQRCHDAAMHRLILGQTLMAYRLDDVSKVINYIKSNRTISHPIGVMGNSVGGSVALYATAIIDEIDFGVFSCCVSQFRESLFEIYHCSDIYIPALALHFDLSDVIGLCAPRPIVLATGVADPIYPIRGFRKAFKHARELYDYSGNEQSLRGVIGHGGHQFYGDLIFLELKKLLRKSFPAVK